MPSRKVLAAKTGKIDLPAYERDGKSAVRFSVLPESDSDAKLQEDIKSSVDKKFENTPFQSGSMIELDFGTSTQVTVPHNLGRPVSGFIICDLIGTAGALSVFREDEVSANAVNFARSKTHVKFRSTLAGVRLKAWVW